LDFIASCVDCVMCMHILGKTELWTSKF